MSVKSTKPKKPSWKKDNSSLTLSKLGFPRAKEISAENDRLRKFLTNKGWEYWGFSNIYGVGYTWTFRKTLKNSGMQKPTIFFEWNYESMDDTEFVGTLRGFYDLLPETINWHPQAMLEIHPILTSHLELFDVLENRIVHGLSYLTVAK